MRGSLIVLLMLLALPARAVLIDDRDVLLDSGKSLEQAIIDGDIGGGGGGGGDIIGAVNLGGGLANYDSENAGILRFNSFSASDFNLAANTLTIDTATWATDTEVAAGYQPLNVHLTDLADGTLLASKIDAAIARDAEVAAAYQPLNVHLTDLADGILTSSKVGAGTASRCARFDGSGNLVAATGDCTDGDTGGGGGGGPSIPDLTFTVDDDAVGTEPANGAGYCIEGGTGDVCFKWDATANAIVWTGPSVGMSMILPDAADGSRGITQPDNTSEPSAPIADSTMLYPLGGEWYKKDNGDGANERLFYNSGNHAPGVIHRNVTQLAHTGTVSQTNVWSTTIPGGTLGTTRDLLLRISGKYQNVTSAGVASFKLIYGSATMWGEQISSSTTAVPGGNVTIDVVLRNTTSTSVQLLDGIFAFGFPGNDDVGDGSGNITSGNSFAILRGPGAIDSTADQTLAFAVTLPNTNADCIFTFETATVELR